MGTDMVDLIDPAVGDLVLIRWTDSGMHHAAEWANRSDILARMQSLDPLRVDTVGYYLGPAEAPEVIAIAQSVDAENDHYLNVQFIHRPAINLIIRLPVVA